MSKASSTGSKLSRSLLGSDAYVATGRARRVSRGPPKKTVVGPLLNCTTESRRRALEGGGEAEQEADEEPMAEPAVSMSMVLATAGAVAFAGWTRFSFVRGLFVASIVVCAGWMWTRRQERQERKKQQKRRPSIAAAPVVALPSCWASSERSPPLPLLELPLRIDDVSEPWMAQAGVAHRWHLKERRFLQRARETYADDLKDKPPYLDAYGDRRLLRFLRQDPSHDEDRALAKVGEYLKWRRQHNADEARARLTQRTTTTDESSPVDKWKDAGRWPHGEILIECIRVLQCSETYFDKKGNAVTVYQAFHWPAPALRKQVGGLSTRQLVDFATFAAEFNAVQMDRIALSREKVLLDHAKDLYEKFNARKRRTSSPFRSRTTSDKATALPPKKNNSTASFDGNDSDDDDDDRPWHRNETPVVRDGWGELTRLCAITDMKGCTFGSIAMPQLIPAVIQAVSIFVNYYPFIVRPLVF